MESSNIQAKLSRLSNLLFEQLEIVILEFVKESALQNNNENICLFGQFINTFKNVNPQLANKLLELGELLVSKYDPISQAAFKIPLWTLIRQITQLVTVNSESSNHYLFMYNVHYSILSLKHSLLLFYVFRFINKSCRIEAVGRTILFNMWRCCE